VGLSLLVILALVAANYKLKYDKYKKTAELFGKQIREMRDSRVEERLFTAALANKVESTVYGILKN
jgi:hypothetical protein